MRPRKRILLIDPAEERLSILKYVLEINGYRALTASTESEAVATMIEDNLDMVITAGPFPNDSHAIILKLKAIAAHIPMVIIGDRKALEGKAFPGADAVLWRSITATELLERTKVMSARKRGPRKGTPRTPRRELAPTIASQVA